jgi:hypothetical protein
MLSERRRGVAHHTGDLFRAFAYIGPGRRKKRFFFEPACPTMRTLVVAPRAHSLRISNPLALPMYQPWDLYGTLRRPTFMA